jgi:hypothetical protein
MHSSCRRRKPINSREERRVREGVRGCARRGEQNAGILRVTGNDNIQRERRRRADELERTARLVRRHGWMALYALVARMPIDNVLKDTLGD